MAATCAAGRFKEPERAQARVAGHLQTVRRDQDWSGNGSMQAAQENSWKTATDRLLDGEKKQVGVSKNPYPRRWDNNRIMLQVGAPIIQKRPAAYACIFEKKCAALVFLLA